MDLQRYLAFICLDLVPASINIYYVYIILVKTDYYSGPVNMFTWLDVLGAGLEQ